MNLPPPSLTTLSNCDQERIHSPGNVQPHGFLLVLEPGTWRIVGASANVKEFFWQETNALIGLSVTLLLGGEVAVRLTALRHEPEFARRAMLVRNAEIKNGDHTRLFSLAAHRTGDVVLLEGEPADSSASIRAEEELQRFLDQMNQADSLGEIMKLAVREVRRVSGFDRCLLYQFDADWNGNVIAEDRNNELPTYLHQRFPAADIPKPARELYTKNRTRLIASNNYRPVPVAMQSGQKPGSHLDLTYSLLRSVSPIHLEYMRNMGTGSSMSVSVICDGVLWGLLSCHSLKPRHVPLAIRTVCDLLGQIISSQITTRERAADLAFKAELAGISGRLLRHLAREPDIGSNWEEQDVLAFGRAGGAVVVRDQKIVRFGAVPSDQEIGRLAEHVRTQESRMACWDKAPVELALTAGNANSVSGLLGVVLSSGDVVLWLRPEIIQVVEWGGDPRKGIDQAGQGRTSLHPRTSFAVWRETVRERSLPWERAVISAVRDFQGVASDLLS